MGLSHSEMNEEVPTTEQNSSGTRHFTKDDPRINREGRPPDSPEKKAQKRLIKDLAAEYRQALAEALPMLSPVLIKQAAKGEIAAIKEVNDRVMGKSRQPIDGGEDDEGNLQPLLVQFIDGNNSRNTDGV